MEDSSGQSLLFQSILLLILTLLTAFFSASEMALVSLNRSRVEQKAEEGHITTVEEVRKALNAEIGGTTAVSYVYRVLKRHGWVKKMPRPKHPKSADEKEQADSKKLSLDTINL